MNRIVLPGATLGVLGSGQLGRMFAIAARRMGYRVHTLSPGIDVEAEALQLVEVLTGVKGIPMLFHNSRVLQYAVQL